MNPIFFQIGSLKIHYYGLMYAIAFYVGIEIAKIRAKKYNISSDVIENYGFVAMMSGLLGGRLYYVIFNADYYFSNPSQILAVWNGGMAIHGGIIGGIIGTIIYANRKNLSAFQLGDIVAPSMILGQAIGRIGNFMNGEIHGVPTFTPLNVIFSVKPKFYEWFNYYNSLSIPERGNYLELVPFGVVFPQTSPAGSEFPNLPLHPAMLYELVLNLCGFAFLMLFFRKKQYAEGTIWWSYVIIYNAIRIVVSFFRAEDLMMFGIRAPHLISLIMIIVSFGIIRHINKKRV